MLPPNLKINSSNVGKVAELRSFLGADLPATNTDLREPQADLLTVAVSKATQAGPGVLVDDVALDVKDADLGVHIKWRLSLLAQLVGRKAIFRVALAYQSERGPIYVYRGSVLGLIGPPQPDGGFGFDASFIPLGATVPLSVDKPPHWNPRAIACQNLLDNRPVGIFPALSWSGPWQS